MKLEQLLEGVSYTLVQGSLELDIEDIIYDSRKAAPGRLFVCIVGTQRDSHDYAAQCVADGVTALVVQHDIDLSTVPARYRVRCRRLPPAGSRLLPPPGRQALPGPSSPRAGSARPVQSGICGWKRHSGGSDPAYRCRWASSPCRPR